METIKRRELKVWGTTHGGFTTVINFMVETSRPITASYVRNRAGKEFQSITKAELVETVIRTVPMSW